MRQAAESESYFRELLSRIREGSITPRDIIELNKRQVSKLSEEEIAPFVTDAVYLFAETAAVAAYNKYKTFV